MQTEKERHQWFAFLDDFSKRNALRPARVDVIGEELGAQHEAEILPFVGASFEPKGSAEGSLEIILGGETATDPRHLTHRIPSVERIVPYVDEAGVEQGLEVESSNGVKTLLLFVTLPELPPVEP